MKKYLNVLIIPMIMIITVHPEVVEEAGAIAGIVRLAQVYGIIQQIGNMAQIN